MRFMVQAYFTAIVPNLKRMVKILTGVDIKSLVPPARTGLS